MPDQHIVPRFDRSINALVSRVLALGGLVEAQTRQAVEALLALDAAGAQVVVDTEQLVDRLEVEIDRELSSALGRRQPRATELRLLTAMSRATNHLERAGDEAERIARAALALHPSGAWSIPPAELERAAALAATQLRKALDAFARLDTAGAEAVLHGDRALDQEFRRFLASVETRMASQPRSIASGVDLVLAAKALERIGDHARKIAECIIYITQGADVRHGGYGAALPHPRTA